MDISADLCLDKTMQDTVNLNMGAKIRAHRLQCGMKLSELAELTGLTSSTISQVERALISPSISTLKKICDAVNIPISYLFEEVDEAAKDAEAIQGDAFLKNADIASFLRMYAPVDFRGHSPVVHKEMRKFLSPSPGIRFYLLTPNLTGPLELIYNEYDPGATTGQGLYTHPGTECGLILSGELEVQIKDDLYVLKEGDSITFNSSEPHLKRNGGDVMCTCVWANTPPWF